MATVSDDEIPEMLREQAARWGLVAGASKIAEALSPIAALLAVEGSGHSAALGLLAAVLGAPAERAHAAWWRRTMREVYVEQGVLQGRVQTQADALSILQEEVRLLRERTLPRQLEELGDLDGQVRETLDPAWLEALRLAVKNVMRDSGSDTRRAAVRALRGLRPSHIDALRRLTGRVDWHGPRRGVDAGPILTPDEAGPLLSAGVVRVISPLPTPRVRTRTDEFLRELDDAELLLEPEDDRLVRTTLGDEVLRLLDDPTTLDAPA